MKRLVLISLLLLAALCLFNCSNDDDTPNGPEAGIDGLSLFGLADDRSLEYFQIDTIVTFDPLITVVETTVETLTVIGSGDDWVIYDNGERVLNLKVSSPYVLQNGYWFDNGPSDELVYFPTPSILMTRTINIGDTWETYTPPYISDSAAESFPCYFTYFGFKILKTYAGREEVLVPAGAYNALRFDVELYRNLTDTTPVATAIEYYYPAVGMVKQVFEARPGFVRTLNLRMVE